MAKGMVVVHEDLCKGCELCISFCPQDMLGLAKGRFNAIGYRPVVVVEPEACTGCEICAIVCPDSVFTVYRARKTKTKPTAATATATG